MARYRSERCLRAFVLAALVLAGCADDPRPHAYAKAPVIEELGPEIEAAAARGPEALAAYFDWTGLTERVAPDGLDAPTRRAFLAGVEQGLRGQGTNGLVDQIAAGTYSYRGVSWRNGLPHARFRFLPPQGGFNFHDLLRRPRHLPGPGSLKRATQRNSRGGPPGAEGREGSARRRIVD